MDFLGRGGGLLFVLLACVAFFGIVILPSSIFMEWVLCTLYIIIIL